jgi:hypothetical protein
MISAAAIEIHTHVGSGPSRCVSTFPPLPEVERDGARVSGGASLIDGFLTAAAVENLFSRMLTRRMQAAVVARIRVAHTITSDGGATIH